MNIIATNLDTDAKSFYYSTSSAGKDLDTNPGSISLILNEKKKKKKKEKQRKKKKKKKR